MNIDDTQKTQPRPWIIGHRGASSSFKENTLEAFVGATAQGAHGVELDVRRSADEVLVVHHDAALSDGRLLFETPSDELPEWVPTLAAALDSVSDHFVNIEIKNHPSDPDYDAAHGISVAVAGLVAAFDIVDRVLVSSFDMDSIQRIRQTDPNIPIGWLVWGQADPGQLIGRAEAQQCQAINPHDLLVDASFVRRAHEAGLLVNVWTVDDPDRIRALAEFGVDAIITNVPDVALAALAEESS